MPLRIAGNPSTSPRMKTGAFANGSTTGPFPKAGVLPVERPNDFRDCRAFVEEAEPVLVQAKARVVVTKTRAAYSNASSRACPIVSRSKRFWCLENGLGFSGLKPLK